MQRSSFASNYLFHVWGVLALNFVAFYHILRVAASVLRGRMKVQWCVTLSASIALYIIDSFVFLYRIMGWSVIVLYFKDSKYFHKRQPECSLIIKLTNM